MPTNPISSDNHDLASLITLYSLGEAALILDAEQGTGAHEVAFLAELDRPEREFWHYWIRCKERALADLRAESAGRACNA